MTTIADYTVGAVKKFKGHDGYGYTCNLLRNKKKVAEILEDGWGGGLQFTWLDYDKKAVVNTLTYDDKPHSFNGTVEEALFYAQVMKMPKIKSYDNTDMHTTPDIVIDDMVGDVLMEKQVKADLKKQFTIQTKDGQLLAWKITPVYTVEVLKKHALKEHPQAIIINELSVPEVIKIYKEQNLA